MKKQLKSIIFCILLMIILLMKTFMGTSTTKFLLIPYLFKIYFLKIVEDGFEQGFEIQVFFSNFCVFFGHCEQPRKDPSWIGLKRYSLFS